MISNKKLINFNQPFLKYNCGFMNDKLSFEVNNDKDNLIDPSFVNSIRRTIEEELYAFSLDEESLDIVLNNTIFNADILKNRLKSLPLIIKEANKYPLDNLDDLVIELNVLNDTHSIIEIYSSDFVFKYKDKVVDNFISFNQIVFLNVIRPGEGIEMTFKLRRDKSSTGGAFYKHTCKNVVYYKPNETMLDKLVKESGLKSEEDIRHFKIENREETYDKNKYQKPMIYIFELKSNGKTSSVNSLKEGLQVLIDKCQRFIKNINNDEDYELLLNENNPNITDIVFHEETHTIGNVLSCYLCRHDLIDVCTYRIPHPLYKKMIVSLHFKKKEDNTLENTKKVFEDKLLFLIQLYSDILKHF